MTSSSHRVFIVQRTAFLLFHSRSFKDNVEYLKFDINCCETVNFRPNLSENEILIYNNVIENSRAFLLSSNLQRNTEVHKTLTQICICGTVLMVAVLTSLTNDGNLSHFNIKLHNYSIPLRWTLPTVYIVHIECTFRWKSNKESSRKIFLSLPVLHLPLMNLFKFMNILTRYYF